MTPHGSVGSFCEKLVFHLMAPLGVLRAGFCSGSRQDWSDLEKFPKSASGEILERSGQHFGLGTFLGQKVVLKKMMLWRN